MVIKVKQCQDAYVYLKLESKNNSELSAQHWLALMSLEQVYKGKSSPYPSSEVKSNFYFGEQSDILNFQ
ncbi:hypothetical protein [Xenorhabdus stockiae]|uniref:hypothetical protein n=1 Tax=Xenorhabdus stockiae TaxID=351614 RepID=UPI00406378A0